MSVNVGTTTDLYTNYASGVNNTDATKPAADKTKPEAEKETSSKAEGGVVYDKTPAEDNKKPTYSINKMSAEDREALVKKLKQDQVNRQQQLSQLVQKMFSKQAGVSKLADLFTPENLKSVSAADIAQAKEDISEDGYWGVKQTSQRLFDFASALAGDDVEKMKEMQKAMEKGYKLATGSWGKELPSICKDTIDAANKLFDDYYASKKSVDETGTVK